MRCPLRVKAELFGSFLLFFSNAILRSDEISFPGLSSGTRFRWEKMKNRGVGEKDELANGAVGERFCFQGILGGASLETMKWSTSSSIFRSGVLGGWGKMPLVLNQRGFAVRQRNKTLSRGPESSSNYHSRGRSIRIP